MAVIVRDARAGDVSAIVELGVANGMFTPAETAEFAAQLAAAGDSRVLVVAEIAGRVVGAAYAVPEPFSDRVWNLLFIATAPDGHGGGVGSAVIDEVEQRLGRLGDAVARVLIVDTSSGDGYDDARRFYLGRGFSEEARIRDYYGPGEAKVTFWKSLIG